VNFNSFGKVGVLSVQGQVYAEPLYVSNLTVAGASHNVVFVVTEQDWVYAFDADTFALLWQVSVLGSSESASDDRNCSDLTPYIGITATPVIDLGAGPNGTIFVVATSKDPGGTYYQRLHALDLTTGAELPNCLLDGRESAVTNVDFAAYERQCVTQPLLLGPQIAKRMRVGRALARRLIDNRDARLG